MPEDGNVTEGAAQQPSTEVQDGAKPDQIASQDANTSKDAPDPAPRGLKGSGLRYGASDGVESWAVGKTADEIYAVAKTYYDMMQRGQTPQPREIPKVTPQEPRKINSNLVYENPDAYTNEVLQTISNMIDEKLGAATSGVVTPISSMAREQARQHRPDVWAKYGPEIDALMADVAPAAKLNVDLWRRAVNMVAGEHVDELAREKAEQLLRSGDVGSLPTGGGVTPPQASSASPIRKLFAANDPAIQPHKEAGLSAEDVIAHYAKMGRSEEKAAEMLKNNATRKVLA